MKKRHIFYLVYFAVTMFCIIISLKLNPVHGGTYHGIGVPVYGDTVSKAGDIMLFVSGGMIGVGFLYFVIRKIQKTISERLKDKQMTE